MEKQRDMMEEKAEKLRKQAFLDYQKTGVMNDIVRQEFEAYSATQNKGIKVRIYVLLSLLLFLFGVLLVLFVAKFYYTRSVLWGLVSACWLFVIACMIYVCTGYKKRRKGR